MIATSIEQSRRLLDAGLDPGSADMFWINVEVWNREEKRLVCEWFINVGQSQFQTLPHHCPAWSLSALWQVLYDAGEIYEFSTDTGPDELIESLVTIICSHYAPAPSEQ